MIMDKVQHFNHTLIQARESTNQKSTWFHPPAQIRDAHGWIPGGSSKGMLLVQPLQAHGQHTASVRAMNFGTGVYFHSLNLQGSFVNRKHKG